MSQLWWFPVAAGVLVLLAAYFWRPRRKASRAACLLQAKRGFHVQRERLEAKFVQLASAAGKPDTPRWLDCTFADDVSYVRNRATGELSAFVAMTIAGEDDDNSLHGAADAVGNQIGRAHV